MALYRHVAAGTFPGEEWSFTLHTEGTASLTAAQTAWSDATGALWTGALDAVVATEVSMTEVSTASIDEATDRQISRLLDDVVRPGVSAAETLPPQISVVASMRTALATRAGRGRFFLPPLDVVSTTAGRLSTASQTVVLNSVVAMMGVLTGAGLEPVVRGRLTHQSTSITSVDVGDVFDTQRRRRDKLREARISSVI